MIRLKSLHSWTYEIAHIRFYTKTWDSVTILLNTGDPDSEEDRGGTVNDIQKALECAFSLVNSDNVSEIRGGNDILFRFISGIGIPPSSLRKDDLGGAIIAPSSALIDGSLLGSSVPSPLFFSYHPSSKSRKRKRHCTGKCFRRHGYPLFKNIFQD